MEDFGGSVSRVAHKYRITFRLLATLLSGFNHFPHDWSRWAGNFEAGQGLHGF